MLNDSKIAEQDVIAAELRSEAEYETDDDSPDTRRKFIGYFVTRSNWVKMRDLSVFSKLVDQVLGIDGVEFSTIDGWLSTHKDVENQPWDKALVDARQQADQTANAVAMKVDSVYAVSPIKFPSIQGNIF